MKQTRAAFFRSLFLAPAAAIAAEDRLATEALAEAEEFQPAAVYAVYPAQHISLSSASHLQSVWTAAWKRKGIDAPSLLICDPGMRIEALPRRPTSRPASLPFLTDAHHPLHDFSLRVELNGVDISNVCFRADESLGIAFCYKQDAAGKLACDKRGQLLTEARKGRIQICREPSFVRSSNRQGGSPYYGKGVI